MGTKMSFLRAPLCSFECRPASVAMGEYGVGMTDQFRY